MQDPFIRNRNTMKNVSVEVVDLIQWVRRYQARAAHVYHL